MGNDLKVIEFLNNFIFSGSGEISIDKLTGIFSEPRMEQNISIYNAALNGKNVIVIRNDEDGLLDSVLYDHDANTFYKDMKTRLTQKGMFVRYSGATGKRNLYYANGERLKNMFNGNQYIDDLCDAFKPIAEDTIIAIIGDNASSGIDKFIIPILMLACNFSIYYLSEKPDGEVYLATYTMFSFLKHFEEIITAESRPNYLKLQTERLLPDGEYIQLYSFGYTFGEYTRLLSCSAERVENNTKYKLFKVSKIDELIKKNYSDDKYSSEPFVKFDLSYASNYFYEEVQNGMHLKHEQLLNPIDSFVGEGSPFREFYNNSLKRAHSEYFDGKSLAKMSVNDYPIQLGKDMHTYEVAVMDAYLMQVCNVINEMLQEDHQRVFISDLIGLTINDESYVAYTDYVCPNDKTLDVKYDVSFEDMEPKNCDFAYNRTRDIIVKANLPGVCDFSEQPYVPFTEEETSILITNILEFITQFSMPNETLGIVESLKPFINSDLMDDTPIARIKRRQIFYWNYYTKTKLMPENYTILPRSLSEFHLDEFGGINPYSSSINIRGTVEDRSSIIAL